MENERKHEDGLLFSPIFDDYQKSRLLFLKSIADVSSAPDAIVGLRSSGAVALVCPLIYDTSLSVQQGALLALGQLANHSKDMAEEMVRRNILPLTMQKFIRLRQSIHYTEDITTDYQLFKRLTVFLFRSIAKHSAELAKAAVDANVLHILPLCLTDKEEIITQSAIWAVINISKHREDLALEVLSDKHGLLPLLMPTLTSCDLSVVGLAASAISELVKFAQATEILVRKDIISTISKLLDVPDDAVKRIALTALARISCHSETLAEIVGKETHSIRFAIEMLIDEDPACSRNAAVYLFQCTKHDSELIDIILKENGISALIDCIQSEEMHPNIVPILMVLSNLAARGGNIANHIMIKGLSSLRNLLEDYTTKIEIKKIVISIIGSLGSYSAEHANSIAEANLVTTLVTLSTGPATPPVLRSRSKQSFKKIMEECIHLSTLENLLENESPFVKGLVLWQYSKILQTDGETRKWFVSSGWLKKLQEMKPQSSPTIAKLIGYINRCFPPEVVHSFTPVYLEETLAKIEKYEGSRTSLPPLMRETSQNSSEWSLMANPSLFSAESIKSDYPQSHTY